MKFNINEYVRVKLTPEGRAIHATDHVNFWARTGKSFPYSPPKEDDEGWSKWQLWALMKAFGPHIHLGGTAPFETEIEIIATPPAASLERIV